MTLAKHRIFICLIAGAAALFAPLSEALAIDCSTAQTPNEKTICQSPELIELDKHLNSAYRALLALQSSPTDMAPIKEEQHNWLKQTEACSGEEACLKKHYQERVAELSGVLSNSTTSLSAPSVSGKISYQTRRNIHHCHMRHKTAKNRHRCKKHIH